MHCDDRQLEETVGVGGWKMYGGEGDGERGDFGKGHCRHTPVNVIFYLSSLNKEMKKE
jgi:hypothetical protein